MAKVQFEIQQFVEREHGLRLRKVLETGTQVLQDIRKDIRFTVRLPDDVRIHLCCYQLYNAHRVELTSDEQFWGIDLKSKVIYFWTDEVAPDSPPDVSALKRSLDHLAAKVDHQQLEIRHQQLEIRQLQHQSGDSVQRPRRWGEKSFLSVEVVNDLGSRWSGRRDGKADFKSLFATIENTKVSKEEHVQKMWNSIMDDLVCREDRTWKDCRKPDGIVFGGRSHDIDLVLLRGQALSMEYLDAPIELKENIASDAAQRDVVFQVLDRISYCVQAQPDRKAFWGIGMDNKSYVVVQCTPTFDYSVSPLFEINSSEKLESLAKLLNCDFGYIPVTLPKIFGPSVSSRVAESSNGAVFAMDNSTVVKVSKSNGEDCMRNELKMLNIIRNSTGVMVTPLPTPSCGRENPGEDFVLGFEMRRYRPLDVSSDDEIFCLLVSIFWRLAVVHACGIIHNDINPSNILACVVGNDVQYLLSDFGHAYQHQDESKATDQRGATDLFSSIPGVFPESFDNMFARDIESLYWTILYVWTNFHGLRYGSRKNARDTLLSLGGKVSDANMELIEVENAELKSFLTCTHLPTAESVLNGTEPSVAGMTRNSCPADVLEFLRRKNPKTLSSNQVS